MPQITRSGDRRGQSPLTGETRKDRMSVPMLHGRGDDRRARRRSIISRPRRSFQSPGGAVCWAAHGERLRRMICWLITGAGNAGVAGIQGTPDDGAPRLRYRRRWGHRLLNTSGDTMIMSVLARPWPRVSRGQREEQHHGACRGFTCVVDAVAADGAAVPAVGLAGARWATAATQSMGPPIYLQPLAGYETGGGRWFASCPPQAPRSRRR